MKYSRLLVFSLVVAGLLQTPQGLLAQKNEIISLQRDVAQLADRFDKFQRGQDEKIAALEGLIRQNLEANAKLATSLTALQQSLTASVAEQQGKLVQPIASMGNKVDQMSQSFGALQASLDALTSRLGRSDEKLTEILNNVKTLNAPPIPPPSAQGGSAAAAPALSPEILYQNAYRDLSTGKNELAMAEFQQYLQNFPTTENAPKAQYYMGVIYERAEQYDDAVKAYDRVLEAFQENPTTRDAMFAKGQALMKAGRKDEAEKEFNNFIKRYPADDNAAQAKQYLKELAPARPARGGKKR